MGFGVWGLGFGVWGLGFGVQGSGFRVQGLGFRGARDGEEHFRDVRPTKAANSEALNVCRFLAP